MIARTETLFLAALLVVGALNANPIVVYVDEETGAQSTIYAGRKETEACLAVVGAEATHVSCEVSYRLQPEKVGDARSTLEWVALPVFIPAGDASTDAELTRRICPTVEFEGMRHVPKPELTRQRASNAHLPIPADAEAAWFFFLVEVGPKQKRTRFLVTYLQPSIAGRFLYVPLFEEKSKLAGCVLDVIAAAPDTRLRCLSLNSGIVAYESRLHFPLRDRVLIEIRMEGADEPASASSR